jgi:phosphoserine aminotransferase
MTRNIVNFNAGPSGLPEPALRKAQEELLDFQNTGMSIMEHSHRGKHYEEVHKKAIALTKKLMNVPDTHEVLFVQGGASSMFAQVPMNFMHDGKSADYVITGAWSQKALSEAKLVGAPKVAWNGEVDKKFTRIPKQSELQLDPNASYVHMTTNNTIFGTQWHWVPDTKGVPLVADMSSDIMSRPVDTERYAMIYAGAQKNLGPSGVVTVVIDKQFCASGSKKIPVIFRFQTHLENESLYHTPPTFAIYLMKNVLEWMDAEGGLAAMQKRNQKKADTLYGAIEESGGWYASPVEKESRSQMNIVFRLPTEDLENKFVKQAETKGFIGLKGHRSVGGIRASAYNAVSPEGVERFVEFMRAFKRENG